MVVWLFISFKWLWKRFTNPEFWLQYITFPRGNSTPHVSLNLLGNSNSIPISKTK